MELRKKNFWAIAFLTIATSLFAQPSAAVSSNSKSPATVTHLTAAEQAKLDHARAIAATSEDVRPVQAEIDAIVKAHPGYHWEDHGILSYNSGLVANTKKGGKPQ
jgi:hypothetical protein